MFEKYTIQKVLSFIREISTEKEYRYNQMENLNLKPALQRGNENLIFYEITLPLHINKCNVEKCIETVEKTAQTGEVIDWVFQKKYMGTFVIDKVKKAYKRVVKGVVVYAEITFNMLECPQSEEFEQQKNKTPDTGDLISSNNSKIQEIKATAINSFKENIKTSIISASTMNNSLSKAAKDVLSNISSSVASDVLGTAVADVYDTCSNYVDLIRQNTTIDAGDITSTAKSIASIPNIILNEVLGVEG